MGKQTSSNQGEGNPEAADRFNSAEQEFVNSPRGQRKIQQGANVRPEEETELAKAEQTGRERAKDGDAAAETPSVVPPPRPARN
jgi:hypothetical protein